MTEVEQHIDNVISEFKTIFEATSKRIDVLKPGEKLKATQLAVDVAEELGGHLTGPQMYQLLCFLFKKYPGIRVDRGRFGGIVKVK